MKKVRIVSVEREVDGNWKVLLDRGLPDVTSHADWKTGRPALLVGGRYPDEIAAYLRAKKFLASQGYTVETDEDS